VPSDIVYILKLPELI